MPESVWHLRSGSIDELVRADDQWAAWDTLNDRDTEEFGLIASAEPDENDDPLLIRTSALMRVWGRDEDAEAFVAAAVAEGMPDTTESDKRTAAKHR